MKSIKYSVYAISGLLLLVTASCQDDDEEKQSAAPDPAVFDDTPYTFDSQGLPPPEALQPDNVLTEQGVKLGKMLFFEPMLSKDNSISCGSCHNQTTGFSDLATFSVGVDGLLGNRQAMSVFNLAWHTNEFFWDGRAH
ncbi:MAG TPA: cytochrome-c peroxidase, partial [Cryomorphaceae bacterium]|nr:cytochrome-c peroxidase [Cryomorphaceae bacterium]